MPGISRNNARLRVTISKELNAWLEATAHARGKSVSKLADGILEQYRRRIDASRQQRKRKKPAKGGRKRPTGTDRRNS